MNRPASRDTHLRLVPPHVPSDRARATWALRKVRNLANVLRTDDRLGLLLPFIRARIEGELWDAMCLRKGLESLIGEASK